MTRAQCKAMARVWRKAAEAPRQALNKWPGDFDNVRHWGTRVFFCETQADAYEAAAEAAE